MATYKEIKGVTLQTRDEDPVQNVGTWSSDANMNTARISSTGTGSSSEGYIIAGGYYLPPSVDRSVTESYNGTAWTEVADCPQDLTYGNGLGSYTSSLLCSYSQPGPAPGGFGPTTATHQWNGSSWSTKNSMNTFRQNAGTGGTTTAGIVFGGSGPPANANTETWDGTNWTEVGDLNTAKTDIGGGVGTSTAALSASGNPATTEQWDGSSWTEVSDLNTSRQNSGKVGLYTSALCVSGQNPSTYLANVESWDGTSWTEVSDVSAARGYIGGATISGGNATGIVAGGAGPGSPGLLSSTEIWSAPATFNQIQQGQLFFNSTTNAFKETITDIPGATWASAPNLNTPGTNAAGATAGTQTAAMIFAGDRPTRVTITEQFNGSSWTEVGDLNTGRNSLGGAGTSTSALGFGGGAPGYTGATESWNGSAWTEVADLNQIRQTTGAGPSNSSALAAGGYDPSAVTGHTEEWGGSSWTTKASMNTARYTINNTGTATALISAGGITPPHRAQVESWDGSAWTEVGDLNVAKNGGFNSGTQTSAIYSGGNAPPGNLATAEFWNGSSWTEIADLATAGNCGGNQGAGTSSAAIIYGGTDPRGAATEEFTAGLSNKTITAS